MGLWGVISLYRLRSPVRPLVFSYPNPYPEGIMDNGYEKT
jgi:hypothetical protein